MARRRCGWRVRWTLPWVGLLAVAGCHEVGAPTKDEAATPIRRLRRLSSREYNNVVRDLLGDTTRPADRFLVDTYPNGYDNGSAGARGRSHEGERDQGRTEG